MPAGRQLSEKQPASRRGSEPRATVFIADDNELTRRALSGIISRDERLAVVGEASNGVAALEMIQALQPELLCLDVLMPRQDGLEVLRGIREKQLATAVIIVTGESTAEVVAQSRELGADGLVVKPFKAAKVLSTIHNVLARRAVKKLAA
jgi:two-component system, chemotaxis family, chemotaxis protein CheY